ncbi:MULTISPECIES: GNAT family N-acetyltransferase [unclassified Brevundimonas]|uniref:GNAT family N-acetyltransferase n=1 Tax=unclassified Brevundimonas TaxID=2622653 RepID=UPI0025B7D4F8|nr:MULTISPECIES: GNAT family N-acetyltransferase [unclassified Brevundimonas]
MSGPLSVEIRNLADLSAEEGVQWNKWARADPDLSSPYFRWEFARTAGPICPGSAVAVFKRDGRIVGYYPHQRRGGTVQPLAAPMNDYHGVIGPREDKPSMQEAAALIGAPRFAAAAWIGEAPQAMLRNHSVVSVVPDEGGFDAWYARRRKAFPKYFKDKERSRRGLDGAFRAVEIEIELHDHALLKRLIIEKSEQYRRTGHHDIFACGWTGDVLHALMDCRGEDGFGASMAVLRVDGRVVAMEYSMHAGRHFHLWFPVYEQEVARWSPGIVLTQETIRLGSERGYRIFDYGVGVGGNYKKYYDDGGLVTVEGVVARPGVGAAMCATASAALGVLGHARAERLRISTRRRWSVVEACETSLAGQASGVLRAAADMVRKQKAAGSADR